MKKVCFLECYYMMKFLVDSEFFKIWVLEQISTFRDIGIDLGTANTLIHVSGKVILEEPSVVAMDLEEGVPLAVGEEANQCWEELLNIKAARPLRDGVIADFDAAEQMIKTFIQKCNEGKGLVAPRIVICIPSGITSVERRAVREAG